MSPLFVRLSCQIPLVAAQEIEDDEGHRHGHVPIEHASADVREMGLAPLPRHELAVEYESGWEAAQLRQDRRHVPAPAAADVQAIGRRKRSPESRPTSARRTIPSRGAEVRAEKAWDRAAAGSGA